MSGLSKRGEAIKLMRESAREAAHTKHVTLAHRDLLQAMESLLQDFRTEFDVPGCRYYEIYPSRRQIAVMPGERGNMDIATNVAELTRIEFLARKGLRHGEDEI